MKLTRMQTLLALALLGVALLAWFAPQDTNDEGKVIEPAARSRTTTQPAPAAAPDAEVRQTALAPEPRQALDGKTPDLFKSASWFVPPPPPPPQAAIPPPPPPPPQAPPLPFSFMGRYDDGVKAVFLLARGDLVMLASVGEKLDGSYQLEALQGDSLVINYLPLNQKQTLDVGAPR
ncbi:MAG: hypothetical protein IPJ21_06590 [Sterolibacteriaceae bacterium]|nr:hypothetical protein [Sterolibacteriaceae bacterium]MBK9087310.1 hypothetical protein [Sterolibacteriaceae bacterium]